MVWSKMKILEAPVLKEWCQYEGWSLREDGPLKWLEY